MTARTVAFAFDPIHAEHDPGQHPENPGRLDAVMQNLERAGLFARLRSLPVRAATPDELTLVHTPAHVELIQGLDAAGGSWIDADTVVVPGSFAAASHAAGAALAGVDAVLNGDAHAAYCLVRPPGHHATPDRAMGFCLFNNVALVARYAQRAHGLARVAIVDIDVHHGNGTQAIYWDDASVLYQSLHEYPFYPGTGDWREQGGNGTEGHIVNVPLPVGSSDAEYLRAFDELLLPLLHRFRPELLLISAGYDAHLNDPLADMALSTEGYRAIMARMRQAADECCDGRLVAVLEGGYHHEALAQSVAASLEVLLVEERPVSEPAPHAHTRFEQYLVQLRRLHRLEQRE